MLHRNVYGVANDKLNLIVVVAPVSCRPLDIGRAHHKGETILSHADIVVIVASCGAIESFRKVTIVISHVKTNAYAIADFKAVICRDVVSAPRVKVLPWAFISLCVGEYPEAPTKPTESNFGVDLAEVKFCFLVVVVVQVTDIPADPPCLKRETCIEVVFVGVNI
mgnify:CR=1 FL=1